MFMHEKKVPHVAMDDCYISTNNFSIPPAFIKATFNSLYQKSILTYNGVNNEYYYEIADDYADILWDITVELAKRPKHSNSGASEDRWEPLTLDRSSESAQAAIAATETLIEAVRGDNGFAQNEPESHASVLWSLKAGLDAIKNHLPTADQIKSLLKRPI